MPTYDYVCDACKHEFEAYESIMLDAQTICPNCHAVKLRRKIGPGAAILFKGSGFYQTDYRSESYKQGAKADKPADAPAKPADNATTSSTSSTPAPPAPAKADSPKSSSNPGASS